ncbi:MAG: iron-sulfur cluster assembly scaffold protein [Nanoarchaeota archaeon]
MTNPNELNIKEEIYRENILDHFKNPHNFGELAPCSFYHCEVNQLCGDEVKLFVKLDDKETVAAARFNGHGCAISVASASMLTDYIIGKSIGELKCIQSSEIIELLGVKLSVVRMKCGLLVLKTLRNGIKTMEVRQ